MKILHAGCGNADLPDYVGEGEETRLDIDPSMRVDVVASLTDMGEIGPFDVAYSAHCLEHLYPHEVGTALGEFLRVIAPGGRALIVVPDLEDIRPTTDKVYDSPSGPICGLDMFYGHSRLIPSMPHMAHHCGFVADTLRDAMEAAGFASVTVKRSSDHNLTAVGVKA